MSEKDCCLCHGNGFVADPLLPRGDGIVSCPICNPAPPSPKTSAGDEVVLALEGDPHLNGNENYKSAPAEVASVGYIDKALAELYILAQSRPTIMGAIHVAKMKLEALLSTAVREAERRVEKDIASKLDVSLSTFALNVDEYGVERMFTGLVADVRAIIDALTTGGKGE